MNDEQRAGPRSLEIVALVAGSSGRERAPVRKAGSPTERWFEPLHVQDPAAARERIAAQVTAGADVVMAPTWRTHRRALMGVGESRRAFEWTQAAVELAREAIDAGLERRDEEKTSADEGGGDEGRPRPAIPIERDVPRVAGVVPILEDEPEPGTGRLLAEEPAAARDYDEAAGHLADADVDLIIVETRVGERGARMAIESAARTGVPVWAAATGSIPADAPAESAVASWVETAVDAGAVGLLLPDAAPEVGARAAGSAALASWGGLVGESGERTADILARSTSTWLEVGAHAIGLLRGADPDRVRAMRAAIDERTREELERERARSDRWESILTRGAAMAPGGAAIWMARAGGDPPSLPPGFAWTRAAPSEVGALPADHFRLALARGATRLDLKALASALEHGGILVAELEPGTAPPGDAGEEVRLVSLDGAASPTLAIYRRER